MTKTKFSFSIFIFLLAVIMASLSCNALATISSHDLKDTILVLDRARTNGYDQLQEMEQNSTENELREFHSFLHYLSRRIGHYCQEIDSALPPITKEDLPCDEGGGATSQEDQGVEEMPASIYGGSPQEENNSAEILQSLEEALGDFDAMLLKEQEQVAVKSAQQADRQQNSSQSGGGQTGEQSNEQEGAGQSQGQAGKQNGSQSSGSSQQQGKQGQQQGSQSSQNGSQDGQSSSQRTISGSAGSDKPYPIAEKSGRNTPIYQDDDIVARQLREAAEKETDPEIKEKLWEEYRKYKEGIR